jgi:hypothetical protein
VRRRTVPRSRKETTAVIRPRRALASARRGQMDGGAEVSTSAAKTDPPRPVPMSGHSLAPPGLSHPASTPAGRCAAAPAPRCHFPCAGEDRRSASGGLSSLLLARKGAVSMLTQERQEWTTCERGVRPDATAIANEAGTRRRGGKGRLRVLSGACESKSARAGSARDPSLRRAPRAGVCWSGADRVQSGACRSCVCAATTWPRASWSRESRRGWTLTRARLSCSSSASRSVPTTSPTPRLASSWAIGGSSRRPRAGDGSPLGLRARGRLAIARAGRGPAGVRAGPDG